VREESDYKQALHLLRWPKGPVCPRCHRQDTITEVGGTSHAPGLFFCSACKRPFTLTAGTPLAASKLSARAWVQAAYMLSADKPVSVEDMAQALDLSYQTTWYLVQRLLGCVGGYKGRLPEFGTAVKANIAQLRPRERIKLAAWGRRQAKKRAEAKARRVPVPAGALSGLKLSPPPTAAHLDRTEHFLSWVLATPR
jgi:transposase-like protein